MKPILQQMYDYHYVGNLEDADVNDRIKELERTARMVLENGCLLAVSELAQVVIKYDVATSCPFCSKLEWDSDGGGHHMHDDGCLFAIAYQVLTPEAEELINGMDEAASAVETARSLNLDDAVREVAQSGLAAIGPDRYADWDGMGFSATFGAGTNSANVVVVSNKDEATNHLLLYHADEYGRYIETFRAGPWVNRVLVHADELRQANKIKAQEREAEKVAQKKDNFKRVDF